MARTNKKSVLKGFRGAIGKEIVVKQYGPKTVITSYPDMSRVKRTILQKEYQNQFKEAVAYAQSIIRNPQKKAAYQEKIGRGQRVFNAAIREFMNRPGS